MCSKTTTLTAINSTRMSPTRGQAVSQTIRTTCRRPTALTPPQVSPPTIWPRVEIVRPRIGATGAQISWHRALKRPPSRPNSWAWTRRVLLQLQLGILSHVALYFTMHREFLVTQTFCTTKIRGKWYKKFLSEFFMTLTIYTASSQSFIQNDLIKIVHELLKSVSYIFRWFSRDQGFVSNAIA